MALSLQGWLNGLSSSGLFIFCCVLGLFCIYKSKKTNAKLLFYMGLATFFVGFAWLGDIVDFMTILLTGKNMDNPHGLKSILGFMWAPPSILLLIYVGTELLIPEKKWYIVSIYLVLGIILELFIFIDPIGSFTVVYPDKPGEDLIDDSFNLFSPAGVIAIIFYLSVVIICGFGFLYKSIQSEGVIRKKFLLLSIGVIFFLIAGIIDGLTTSGVAIFLVRIGMIGGLWISYLGIREEPEKKEKIKPKKEVKVKGDLFRISQYKKEDITEEEVSISKEKKICLVCKGKAIGFNIYVCRNCETIYCQKCVKALTELENACWACGISIDESKPVKPYKKVEEEIEISEKPQKKPKIDKKTFKK